MSRTKGPWTADRARPDGWVMDQWVVRGPEPINACTNVIAVIQGNNEAIAEANARAIAKVPKLLRIASSASLLPDMPANHIQELGAYARKLLDELEEP